MLVAIASAANARLPSAVELIDAKFGGKWGVLDKNGTQILPFQYDSILIGEDGLISAEQGESYSYFDANGTQVLAGFRNPGPVDRNGYRTVQGPNGRTGLIDGQSRQILPFAFGYISVFDDQQHYVVHYKGRAVVIDLKGKPLFPQTFFYVAKLGPNGLAIAKSDVNSFGVIDKTGAWVIEPGRFEWIADFSEDGLASAKIAGKSGFIDRTGKWIVPPLSEDILWLRPFDALGTTAAKVGSKWGFIDRKGKFVVTPKYDSVMLPHDGAYTVTIGEKKAIVDGKGHYILKPKFDNFTEFHSEGLAAAWIGKQSFIIDRNGKSVFGNRFERVGGFFGGGWAAAQSGGKWGAIDTKGNWILKPQYQCVSICFDDPPPVVVVSPLID